MNDSDFTKLLTQAIKAAKKHRGLIQRINKECVMRFGHPYGDLSLSETIELESAVGVGMLTAKRFELLMDDQLSGMH